tara:strand:+ start:3803 stop:4696 length:894 start_codon:yes stop_codon:yes gene_type:complete
MFYQELDFKIIDILNDLFILSLKSTKMRLNILLLLFIASTALWGQKTPDDKKRIKKTWARIFNSDQGNRGSLSKDSIDFSNLEKVCKLIEKYGYPKKEEIGKYSKTPWLVWIHCSDRELKELTFGIINKGLLENEITERDYHRYFLRALFFRKFGMYPKRSRPTLQNINNRLEEIGVTKSVKLDILKIQVLCRSFKAIHKNESKIILGIWIKTVEPYTREKVNIPIELYKYDDEYFYAERHKDFQPMRLVLKREKGDEWVFTFKNNHKDEYLEISNLSTLTMFNKEGEVLIEYLNNN